MKPYSTETAFAEWLRLDLEVASGGRTIEAINCGGLSYASYRVRAILDEVLNYQPDLIVIYCGQMNFSNVARMMAGAMCLCRWFARAAGPASFERSSGYAVGRKAIQTALRNHPAIGQRSNRRSTLCSIYSGGLAEYHRDDPWREPVVAHFEFNLQHMVAACLRQRVPVVLCNPVVNLLDCPPMKFETSMNLSAQQREEFEREFHAGARTQSDS